MHGCRGATRHVPRILRVALLSAGIAAAASLMSTVYVGSSLDSELQQLTRRDFGTPRIVASNPNAGSALSLLAKRKQ